jgi:xylulokinase
MQHVIAYDLGTSGIKAVLYDQLGTIIASAYDPCQTYYPQEGFHEQEPDAWWRGLIRSTQVLLHQSAVNPLEIACLSLSGHSLGVVPVDERGDLLVDRVPIWSDSRAMDQASAFFQKVNEQDWYLKTGNGFPAHLYSIFKIMWFKDHLPDMFSQTRMFLGTKDYINLKLTGIFATDYSYASGSGVYELLQWAYCPELIEASGVPGTLLPPIRESSSILGPLTERAAQQLGLTTQTRVACGGVDNACTALGAGCFEEGRSYTYLGSSSWIAVSSAKPVLDIFSRPYVFTHCIPGMFVSATCIFASGNALKWARDVLVPDLLDAAGKSGADVYDLMTNLASQSPAGANKLFFNPSLAGGSSIEASPHIRGAFIGLSLSHTRSDLLRAVLEGVAMNLRIALDVLRACTALDEQMLLVGGGGKSSFWRQIFANVYNMAMLQTNIEQEAGALGAAALAFVGCGLWPDVSRIAKLHEIQNVHQPNLAETEHYARIMPVYRQITHLAAAAGNLMHDL